MGVEEIVDIVNIATKPRSCFLKDTTSAVANKGCRPALEARASAWMKTRSSGNIPPISSD